MQKRQLFFDLDRTLWDFETNSRIALQKMYDELQLGNHFSHFLHFYHTYVRINADLWLRFGKGKITKAELREGRFLKTLAHHGIENTDLAKKLSDDYIVISPSQTNLFAGTKEVLTSLKNDGYKLHIITNGFPEVQHLKLKNSGIDHFFDTVLCSEEVGVGKPNRQIFQHALKTTNCSTNHAVMIGDDMRTDIQGALQAGWQAIHFDPLHLFQKERNVPRIRLLQDLPEAISLLPFLNDFEAN